MFCNYKLFLVELPALDNACNIRETLNEALSEKYEIALDDFMSDFTMAIDGATGMARLANASINREIYAPVET